MGTWRGSQAGSKPLTAWQQRRACAPPASSRYDELSPAAAPIEPHLVHVAAGGVGGAEHGGRVEGRGLELLLEVVQVHGSARGEGAAGLVARADVVRVALSAPNPER